MQYFLKAIEAKTKDTELEHYTLDLIEKIRDTFERLKEVEKSLPKPQAQGIFETEKEFFEKLIFENQQDINIFENWLKKHTIKALEDRDFYKEFYAPAKEVFELAQDRDKRLKGIVNQKDKTG